LVLAVLSLSSSQVWWLFSVKRSESYQKSQNKCVPQNSNRLLVWKQYLPSWWNNGKVAVVQLIIIQAKGE
jgi:high-affinity Fe2+/Pb2+ permease